MFPLNFFQLSFAVFSSLSYYFQLGDMKECQLKKMFHYAQYFCLTLRYTARVSGKYALVLFSLSFTFLEGLVFYFCEEFTDQSYCWLHWCFSSRYWALHALPLTVQKQYAVTGTSCFHISCVVLSTFHSPDLREDAGTCFLATLLNLFILFRGVPKSTGESPEVLIFVLHVYAKFLNILLYYTSFCTLFFRPWGICFLLCSFTVISKEIAKTEKF